MAAGVARGLLPVLKVVAVSGLRFALSQNGFSAPELPTITKSLAVDVSSSFGGQLLATAQNAVAAEQSIFKAPFMVEKVSDITSVAASSGSSVQYKHEFAHGDVLRRPIVVGLQGAHVGHHWGIYDAKRDALLEFTGTATEVLQGKKIATIRESSLSTWHGYSPIERVKVLHSLPPDQVCNLLFLFCDLPALSAASFR